MFVHMCQVLTTVFCYLHAGPP